MKRIVQFLCVGSLLVFLFPIGVHADGATYYSLGSECITLYNNGSYYYHVEVTSGSDVRVTGYKYGDYYYEYFVSENPFSIKFTWMSSQACSALAPISGSQSGNYYVVNTQHQLNQINDNLIPFVMTTNSNSNAIYYTFGEGAVDPVVPTIWGDLLDVKFNTSIAGSGSAATNNIDQITWDPVQDSNGNALTSEQRVEIKAIAGNYTASSRNGLFGLGATDFDYNSGIEHLIGDVAANRGEFHIEWSEVIRQLNDGSISDFLNIRKSDDVWLKSGWIYQYRFIADDYTGEWHTIYNGTSAGVQNSINIEQSTQINTNLINTIVEINTLNNSEYQNWTINNTVINMENSDGQETTDKPWWSYLLEAIVSLIDGVLTFLGNLIGDLISAIIDLFTFDTFDLDVIVDFGTEQRESNNIVGQSINFFDNVVQSAQSMRESDVIISYPGITLFDVELLPAANYNLNDYVEDLGLTDFHNLAYLVTDGSIAICLISLVYRKIMGILRS